MLSDLEDNSICLAKRHLQYRRGDWGWNLFTDEFKCNRVEKIVSRKHCVSYKAVSLGLLDMG